jgi:glucuronoarabinoxylan endo-1,4-beta-xylanase
MTYAGLLVSHLLVGCGGSRPDYDTKTEETPDASTPVVDPEPLVTVDTSKRLQTLEGFGAAVAWYGNWYTDHPNRDALKSILFSDLGLDILRLRNQFRNEISTPDPIGLSIFNDATESLGHPPRVLLTSWTPPANLKANGVLDCANNDSTCTLKRNESGKFVYDEFGKYIADSIEAYRATGIDPYYVSPQNEPEFVPTGEYGWEACQFESTESENYPGYDQAFAAVVKNLEARSISARLLGPETAQVAGGRVERYVAALDSSKLYGVAHHLYGGGDWKSASSFDNAFKGIATKLGHLPIFQTEFSPTEGGIGANDTGFEVAWLIHESLAVEGASAYLHWDLIWPTSGLVSVEDPRSSANWTNENGYTIQPAYYALRHFAKYTEPGDHVVDTQSNLSVLLATTIMSADAQSLSIVLLNRSTENKEFTLNLGSFEPKQSMRIETTAEASWQKKAPLDGAKSNLTLPGRSITTIVATLNDTLPE